MSNCNIVSINISFKKGTKKIPIDQGFLYPGMGLLGDIHGTGNIPNRMLSLLALESINIMKEKGFDVNPGDFAENITTKGIILHTLPIGTHIYINDIKTIVTQIGKKCHSACDIKIKTGDCIMPKQGIFVEVLESGKIQPGDIIKIRL